MDSGTVQLTAAQVAWRLVAVLMLVAANAFFVAAEFSLVGARRSKIDALAKRGDLRSRAVQRVLQNLYRYISATSMKTAASRQAT